MPVAERQKMGQNLLPSLPPSHCHRVVFGEHLGGHCVIQVVVLDGLEGALRLLLPESPPCILMSAFATPPTPHPRNSRTSAQGCQRKMPSGG